MNRQLFLIPALLCATTTAAAAPIAQYEAMIEAPDGRYVVAPSGDRAGQLNANRVTPGNPTTFTVLEHEDGSFTLRSQLDLWAAVEPGDSAAEVVADRAYTGSWLHLRAPGGHPIFDQPLPVQSHHGTYWHQAGNQLEAEAAAPGPDHLFTFQKQGLMARFLDPDGHTVQADGDTVYTGDLEIPATDGQAMLLPNAVITYQRNGDSSFAKFQGSADAPDFVLNGAAGDLGAVAGDRVSVGLRTPLSYWPAELDRAQSYVRIRSTTAATWGDVHIAPAQGGSRYQMIFDHDSGAVHVRGTLDVLGESGDGWMSTGGDLPFDVRTTGIEQRTALGLDIEGAAVVTMDFTDHGWGDIATLSTGGELTVGFDRAGTPMTLSLTDAQIDADIDGAQILGEMGPSTLALPHSIELQVGSATVDANLPADIMFSVAGTQLGDANDTAREWLFSGDVTVSAQSDETALLGTLKWRNNRLDVDWNSASWTDPAADHPLDGIKDAADDRGHGRRLKTYSLVPVWDYDRNREVLEEAEMNVEPRWNPAAGTVHLEQEVDTQVTAGEVVLGNRSVSVEDRGQIEFGLWYAGEFQPFYANVN